MIFTGLLKTKKSFFVEKLKIIFFRFLRCLNYALMCFDMRDLFGLDERLTKEFRGLSKSKQLFQTKNAFSKSIVK